LISKFEHRTLLGADEGDGETAPSSLITKRMFDALEEAKPEVVAVPGWSTRSALAAVNWCVRQQAPAVVMSESTVWDHDRKPFREWMKRRILRFFSSALVGGTAHARYLEMLGMPADRIFRGYDVVDNDCFAQNTKEVRDRRSEVRQEYGLPENYFLASARFIPKKNLHALIRAFARYRELSSDVRSPTSDLWHLVILGDGPLISDLRSLISDLGLIDSVLLPGFKQYDELPVYYGLANAFVHSSTTEQWGLVVNEAMASSLPVLVSNRCGCAQDLVTEGKNGWTLDPFDVGGMAEVMKQCAERDTEERNAMGKNSYDRIEAFSPATFADGLSNAVECALRVPRITASFADRFVLRALRSR
jgi:glycosyltransferase involved in cell wall biosynthesis